MTKAMALLLVLAAISMPATADQRVEAPATARQDPQIQKDFSRLDANGDGSFSFVEFAAARWPDRLAHFDANHDGRISLLEYQQATCVNEGADTAENRQIIADCYTGLAYDAHGVTEWTSGDGFPDLVFAFRLLDCDRNGEVTAQEYLVSRTARCSA